MAKLVLSEEEHGDFQFGWVSGSGYKIWERWMERERFRAEDATLLFVPPQVMTDTPYFHGIYSQILHSCWCVGVHSRALGFITEVKTMQIRPWRGSAVLNLLIKCTCCF